MTVRTAAPEDIPFIQRIAHATWPVAYRAILSAQQLAYMLERMYSASALAAQMTGQGHRFLLALRDEAPIGFASFGPHHAGERSTRLHKLYVLPTLQGTGAGRALLHAVETEARAAGDARLELNVNRSNPAKVWYERQGFTVVRDEVIDIGGGFVMDDHVMVKRLG